MMVRFARICAGTLMAAALLASACGGDDDAKDGDTTSTPGSGATAAATGTRRAGTATASGTVAAGTTATAGTTPAPATTAASGTTPAAPPPPPQGRIYTAGEAQAALNAILLKPGDLPGAWTLTTDQTTDNAAAKAADPEAAAGVDRCGRLLGGLTVNQAADAVAAFLAGETLSFFSTVTFYATEAGAIDCATEAAGRFSEPGELARAFGSIFINPDAVNVALATYEPVADGSFAATLTGQISAAGNVIDLTIFIVAFRSGNMSAVVGSARSGSTPPSAELKTYVDEVLRRIEANQ